MAIWTFKSLKKVTNFRVRFFAQIMVLLAEVFASSDEVERGILLLKALVDDWWLVSSATSLSYQSSESVGVSDHRRLLDRTADIVVGPAQLVGQVLDLVRRVLDFVVDNGIPGGSRHALSRSH